MKRKLPYVFYGIIALASFFGAKAQDYEHLTVTSGYNHDVIANGLGVASSSTTIGVDNVNWAFMSTDFQATAANTPPSYALPLTGLINSVPTPGLSYQLGDYSGNNSLRIGGSESGSPLTATMAFSNQVSAKKLYVLASSGSGASTVTSIIHFTDNTTQTITGTAVPDWFNSTVQPVAASGFGRVSRNDNVMENPAGNPRMYQLTLNIDAVNQPKLIESIEFIKTSVTEGAVNVFAVTAELLGTCPSPDAFTTLTTAAGATISWTEPVILPGIGYDYYYSTDDTAPTEETEPTGNVAAGVTMVELEGLVTGATYYFWVRSNCSEADQGTWAMVSFTTGQVSATYTDGDIETLYLASPNANSTTTCPGLLTVTVPDGYQAVSVATSYSMTSSNNGYMSEQRTKLHCVNTNTGENSLAQGAGNVGTFNYSRSGLDIADGATGDVNFEMRAWRTWQGGGSCNTTYNKVDNNTWTVTITYECVTPPTPQANAEQAFCPGSTVADLVAETDYEDAELRWYAAETGGEALAAEEVLTGGTYYVAQHRYTCESERQAVVVSVSELSAPEAAVAQALCSGATVSTLSADGVEGAVIHWYATADSTEALEGNATLETGSYFVSQSLNGCESERTEVNVTITEVLEPVVDVEQDFCDGATVSELGIATPVGADTYWYVSLESEEPLTGDTELVTGSYFVAHTFLSCESARVEVAVTVNTVPVAPGGDDEQEFTAGDTVASLEVEFEEGAELHWYAFNGEEYVSITPDTVLADGETYHVSQSVNGCESELFSIHVDEALSVGEYGIKGLVAYPNPVSNALQLSAEEMITGIIVYNLPGQKVMEVKGSSNEMKLDFSQLSSGTYILEVNSGQKITRLKIVRQ